MSSSDCRRWREVRVDPFVERETNAIVLRPFTTILSYGRLRGEVAIKVIRLGSASVKSLPLMVPHANETVAYVLLIFATNRVIQI